MSHQASAVPGGATPEGEVIAIRLECRRGEHPPVTIRIARGRELLVGRSGGGACEVEIHDPTVSQRHARLVWGDEGLLLEDLGSKNGTWCNQIALQAGEAMPVAHESRIDLGKASFRVRLLDADEALRTQVVGAAVADDGPLEPGSTVGTIDLREGGRGTLSILVEGLGSDDPDVAERARHRVAWFYEPFVHRYLRSICGPLGIPRDDVDEIAQEAWASLLGTLARGFDHDASGSFRSYLGTVCWNHARRYRAKTIRRQNREVATDDADRFSDEEIERSVWDEYQKALVAEAVQAVRADLADPAVAKGATKRQILDRYVLQEMRKDLVRDFAAELGESMENVRQIARRLRIEIARKYHELDRELGGDELGGGRG